jgi:hypothetical protein
MKLSGMRLEASRAGEGIAGQTQRRWFGLQLIHVALGSRSRAEQSFLVEPALEIVTLVAGTVVVLTGAYLLGFGVLAVADSAQAFRYLRRFAGTLPLHVLELSVRFMVGAAFIGYASQMQLRGVFHTFGIILATTTLGLALIPWRWHQRLAHRTVPAVERYIPVIGVASIAAGAFVLWAWVLG